MDVRIAQQLPHHRRGRRIAHREQRVDLAVQQRLDRRLGLAMADLRAVAGLDAVRIDQRLRQRGRAAAFEADVQPLALELRQQGLHVAAIEDHQRLVRDAAQRDQPRCVAAHALAADDEADVDRELGIRQAREVLARTLRRQDLQRHAFACEDLAVLLRGDPERAAVGPAGHDQDGRRRRIEEDERKRPDADADDQDQPDADRKPVPHEAGQPRVGALDLRAQRLRARGAFRAHKATSALRAAVRAPFGAAGRALIGRCPGGGCSGSSQASAPGRRLRSYDSSRAGVRAIRVAVSAAAAARSSGRTARRAARPPATACARGS